MADSKTYETTKEVREEFETLQRELDKTKQLVAQLELNPALDTDENCKRGELSRTWLKNRIAIVLDLNESLTRADANLTEKMKKLLEI